MDPSTLFLQETPQAANNPRVFRRSLADAQGTLCATYDITALDEEAQLLAWDELIALCADLSAVYDEPGREAIVSL